MTEDKYHELGVQQQLAHEAEARRMRRLHGEVNAAREHVDHIEDTQDRMFGLYYLIFNL